MNKEVNKQSKPSFLHAGSKLSNSLRDPFAQRRIGTHGILRQPPIGITGIPLMRNCVPDTITLSPGLSPEVME